jgi:hypothetical protein
MVVFPAKLINGNQWICKWLCFHYQCIQILVIISEFANGSDSIVSGLTYGKQLFHYLQTYEAQLFHYLQMLISSNLSCTTLLAFWSACSFLDISSICTLEPNMGPNRSVLITLLNQTKNRMIPFYLPNTERSYSVPRIWNGAIPFYCAHEPNTTLLHLSWEILNGHCCFQFLLFI